VRGGGDGVGGERRRGEDGVEVGEEVAEEVTDVLEPEELREGVRGGAEALRI
jgi:hypothetical protein